MHAVLITFGSKVSKEDLAEPFTDYANAMTTVEGLVSKTWIADGEVLGGFHIFESRQAADVYLGSEMVAGLTSNPAFSGFEISHYDVLEELSRITGSPSGALARAG